MEETQNTMIQVKKDTATLIKSYKITNLETYDEIINRLLKEIKKD